MRTQVAIVGAGPAGLLLSHLLGLRGIESVIIENRSRAYVEARQRAGVLEQGTVDTLLESGVGERLKQEGLRHDGIYLQWPGERHRINFAELCGRSVWVYGQTEMVKDLIEARLAAGQQLQFEVSGVTLEDLDGDRPVARYIDSGGGRRHLDADIVVGADGFHGVSRPSIPAPRRRTWERDYPFAWLGILATVPPSTDELIYVWHPRGFALHSMRSPSVSRLYLQVDPGEKIENWPDERIWAELAQRMQLEGWSLREGPVTDKSITPMRSFVSTPMRYGRLFLVGDAAHIVPPTGAKGLNLAVSDVRLLAAALGEYFAGSGAGPGSGSAAGREYWLNRYPDDALAQVWRKTHFSWWMTTMLHIPGGPVPGADFEQQLQLAQLRYVTSSVAAATELAENYTGLPLRI